MNKEDKKWAEFEELVAKIQREVSKGAVVKHNDKIKDQSGVIRQIDVSIKTKTGFEELLIVVECKRYSKKVPINVVEEFVTKINDLGASRGVLVSNRGFTDGALKKAEFHRIKLYTITDALITNWDQIVGNEAWLHIIKSEIDSLFVVDEKQNYLKLKHDSIFIDTDKNQHSLINIFDVVKHKAGIGDMPGEFNFVANFNPPITSIDTKESYSKLNFSVKQRSLLYVVNLEFDSGVVIKNEIDNKLDYQKVYSQSIDWKKVFEEQNYVELTEEKFLDLRDNHNFKRVKSNSPKKYIRLEFRPNIDQ